VVYHPEFRGFLSTVEEQIPEPSVLLLDIKKKIRYIEYLDFVAFIIITNYSNFVVKQFYFITNSCLNSILIKKYE